MVLPRIYFVFSISLQTVTSTTITYTWGKWTIKVKWAVCMWIWIACCNLGERVHIYEDGWHLDQDFGGFLKNKLKKSTITTTTIINNKILVDVLLFLLVQYLHWYFLGIGMSVTTWSLQEILVADSHWLAVVYSTSDVFIYWRRLKCFTV